MQHISNLIESLQYEKALNLLDQHIAENPNDDHAYYLRGDIYNRMNSFGEALNAYSKAVELNPKSPAKIKIQILNEILAYRNTDLINP